MYLWMILLCGGGAGKVEATTAVYKNRMQLTNPMTDAEPKEQSQQDHEENPHNDGTSPSSATGGLGDPAPLDLPPEALPAEEERDEQRDQSLEQPVPPSLETEPISPEQWPDQTVPRKRKN